MAARGGEKKPRFLRGFSERARVPGSTRRTITTAEDIREGYFEVTGSHTGRRYRIFTKALWAIRSD